MKTKNKLIQSLFAIFMIVVIVSTGFVNIVNVASANSNDNVANATTLNEPNDKTANTTFPSKAANNLDDYTLTEFKEGVGGKNVSSEKPGIEISAPEEEWSKTFGGTRDDEAYSVQQTSDGGYILAGPTGV